MSESEGELSEIDPDPGRDGIYLYYRKLVHQLRYGPPEHARPYITYMSIQNIATRLGTRHSTIKQILREPVNNEPLSHLRKKLSRIITPKLEQSIVDEGVLRAQ